jgi:hypothetical protein
VRPHPLLAAAAPALAALVLSPARASSQLGSPHPAAVEITLAAAPRAPRKAAWADTLPSVEVSSALTGTHAPLRLYTSEGSIDAEARARFEQIAAGDGASRSLSPRVEQLVFKAAYHFAGAGIVIVSGYRDHAGRHTACEAVDFKLVGVRAAQVAAWLRDLPRAGVGIYTHRRTQYVHLDVRDTSYHWIDGSPPGVTWKERQIGDPDQVKRDASWTAELDLPTSP